MWRTHEERPLQMTLYGHTQPMMIYLPYMELLTQDGETADLTRICWRHCISACRRSPTLLMQKSSNNCTQLNGTHHILWAHGYNHGTPPKYLLANPTECAINAVSAFHNVRQLCYDKIVSSMAGFFDPSLLIDHRLNKFLLVVHILSSWNHSWFAWESTPPGWI